MEAITCNYALSHLYDADQKGPKMVSFREIFIRSTEFSALRELRLFSCRIFFLIRVNFE